MQKTTPNALPWLALSALVIVLDQLSKAWVLASLPEYTAIPVIDGFWNWYRTYNTGAAFSFLSDAGGWQQYFFIALAREPDRIRVLKMVRDYLKPDQRAFVGVIDPLDPRVETAQEVRDRVLEAAKFIPIDQLGTTDDCGFAPFSDDTSTSRDTAFEKIRARVAGTALAAEVLG